MTAQWNENEIASLLASAFAPDLAASSSTTRNSKKQQQQQQDTAPTATIDVLLTFDRHGISNHPNHRSLYHGAVHFLRVLMKEKAGFACPVTLYTLTSTTFLRKYAGVLDAPLTMLLGAWSNLFAKLRGPSSRSASSASSSDPGPARMLFVSSVTEWLTAQSAMVKGHKSQMVWFRWGWISVGRYMTVNDLQREKV